MEKVDNEKENKRLQKVKELVKDLTTNDEKKFMQALKGLQVHGDSSILPTLINTWANSNNPKINESIAFFINDLKQSDSIPFIMDALGNDEYKHIKRELLNTIWNSKVDYSSHLSEFVKIAVEGEFMQALECLTIIENMEGPFKEHQFLDAQMELSKYANAKNKEEKKAHIMSDIAEIIQRLEREHVE